MKTIFFFLLAIGVFNGSAQDTLVLSDLRHGWMGLTKKGEFVPVLDRSKHEVVVFETGKTKTNPLFLKLSSDSPVDIWFGSRLLYHDFDSTIYLPCDTISVNSRFKVFSAGGIPGGFQSKLVTIRSLEVVHDPISEKKYDFFNERYLIIGTVLLLMGGVFRRYFPITFNQSFRNPLTYKIRSISVDQTYVAFGSMDNLYSILFFGVLVSFVMKYLGFESSILAGEHFFIQIINWLLVGLVVALSVMAKFMLTKMLSSLFLLKELPNIQTQDFVHFYTLVVTATAMISFLDFSFFDYESLFFSKFSRYLLVMAVIFFQIWLFLKLDKFYAVRKLVIISYLCTTEFLPGFLTIYWLMKM